MAYERTEWRHDNPNSPVDIYSELDEDRWEVRKVEVFADGRMQYSDGVDSTGDSGLSEVPLPPITPREPGSPLHVTVVDEETFDRMWDLAVAPGADQPRR
jgi:uncharacterized protein YpuA (DUF1002 family)